MTVKEKSQKKPPTLKRLFRNVFSLVAVGVSVFLLNASVREWIKVYQSKQELNVLKSELSALNVEEEKLQGLKGKLSDPNYVQNYARGKHLMSKSDEQVFILPKAKD